MQRTSSLQLLVIALFAICVAFSGQAEAAGQCRVGTWLFEISREGERTGLLEIRIKDQDSRCEIESDEWIQSNFLGVTQYCHYISRKETWSGDQLLTFDSNAYGWCSFFARTARPSSCRWPANGGAIQVSAESRDNETIVTTPKETLRTSEPVGTRNFMSPLFPRIGELTLIDPLSGSLFKSVIKLDVKDAGFEHLSYSGKFDRRLKYNQSGTLINMTLPADDVQFNFVVDVGNGRQVPEPGNSDCKRVFAHADRGE